ncbi:MAG: hypothetical protein GEU75_14530 [Dehalococcoidia bacterium]|nr:hypothetical protein [Dehalococcoidia bacterium]
MNKSLLRPAGGVLVAASALGAAAWHELEHRRVYRAELQDGELRVERLRDLRPDSQALATIEEALRREWGSFGLLGFDDVAQMARECGDFVLVASSFTGGQRRPKGCVQVTLADVHGDPEALASASPSFDMLTSREAMRRARRKGGDTVVMLQLTIFSQEDRGSGLGSLLRNAVLHMLPEDVKYALTTTPLDLAPGSARVDLAQPATWTPAMRFHARGGAEPVALLPGYKASGGAGHGGDVAVMKYSRTATGAWPAERPEMRVRSRGPLQERAVRAGRFASRYGRRLRGGLRLRERLTGRRTAA